MTDRKSGKGARRRPRKRGRKIQRSIPLNEMMYQSRWEMGTLTSGTSGTIASNMSPTIQGSSEYSVLQNLFTEIKLVRATFIFTGRQQSISTVAQGRLWVGTNMIFTDATFSAPTSATAAQNLTRTVQIPSNTVRPYRYRFPVPPQLEYSNITQDSPTTATPWAGSPGGLVIWGDNLTTSTIYFVVDFVGVFHLRGRQ